MRQFKQHLILVIFCFFSSFSLMGQGYPLGLVPSSVEWEYFDKNGVRLIYPKETRAQAFRVADLVTYMQDSAHTGIGDAQVKIPIILQSYSATVNGFVSMAPKRSEFYMAYPQDNFGGAMHWVDQLAIHEFRHAQQHYNNRKGLTKFMSWPFSTGGWAVAGHMLLPRWYWEGDAVVTESLYSHAGRGRSPYFNREYRAVLLERGKIFRYDKASLGSFKEMVPSYYNLGYYMSSYIREVKGDDYLEMVRDKTVKYVDFTNIYLNRKDLFNGIYRLFNLPYAFSGHLEEQGLDRTPELYRTVMENLYDQWNNDYLEKIEYSTGDTLSPDHKYVANYRRPIELASGDMLVERSTYKHQKQLVVIDQNQKVKVLFTPGNNSNYNTTFSTQKNLLAITELSYDMRWANVEYSNIILFDLDKFTNRRLIGGKKLNFDETIDSEKFRTQITKKGRYYAPDLSPTKPELVAIQQFSNGASQLEIIDYQTKKTTWTWTTNQPWNLSFPKYSTEGEKIYFIATSPTGNALMQIDIKSQQLTTLIDFIPRQISQLNVHQNHIYFQAGFSDIGNIYRYDLIKKQIHQITDVPFSADFPSITQDGKSLLYSNYSSNGFSVKKLALENDYLPVAINTLASPLEMASVTNVQLEEDKEEVKNITATVPKGDYEPKKYSRLKQPFNLHTILPTAIPPDLGLSLSSTNISSTLQADLALNYNTNDQALTTSALVEYGAWFPVVYTGVSLGSERNRDELSFNYIDRNQIGISTRNVQWNENNFFAGVKLPFNLSNRHYTSNLTVDTRLVASSINYKESYEGLTSETVPNSAVTLSYWRGQRSSYRQIKSRWAQAFSIYLNNTLPGTTHFGDRLQVNASLNIPSIFPTHYGQLQFSTAQQDINVPMRFSDRFQRTRGVNHLSFKGENNTTYSSDYSNVTRVTGEYEMPLWYPDIHIRGLTYLRRIRLKSFIDISASTYTINTNYNLPNNTNQDISFEFTQNSSFLSFGLELNFDFNVFRLLDLNAGVRAGHVTASYATMTETESAGENLWFIEPIVFGVTF